MHYRKLQIVLRISISRMCCCRALRVSPAVTRLTVYRRPQVMRAGAEHPHWGPKLCVARTGFKHEMLRIYLSDHDAELE